MGFLPRLTLGMILVIIVAYLAGAKWPGLARMIGIAG